MCRNAATHDAFRGVRGSFDWTMRIIADAADLGLPLQINTTVSRLTCPSLKAMSERVRELPILMWAVFFLVATGRGAALEEITAAECEEVLNFLCELAPTVPFSIKTTEAPHYHRVLMQRRVTTAAGEPSRPAGLRAGRSVTDGNGFLFINHAGQICPSGFLPVVCGNVRRNSLVETYRNHEMFKQLRNPDSFEGTCGRCEFRHVCGGSRARAYAPTESAFGSDPLCVYMPVAAV